MSEKTFPMTLEGKEKLEKELEYLKTEKRAEIFRYIHSEIKTDNFQKKLDKGNKACYTKATTRNRTKAFGTSRTRCQTCLKRQGTVTDLAH